MVFVEGHFQLVRHFSILGFTPFAVFNGADSLGDTTGIAMDGTRHPIAFADFVNNGTANADAGIGFERGAFGCLVFLGGFKQADHSGLHEVFKLH